MLLSNNIYKVGQSSKSCCLAIMSQIITQELTTSLFKLLGCFLGSWSSSWLVNRICTGLSETISHLGLGCLHPSRRHQDLRKPALLCTTWPSQFHLQGIIILLLSNTILNYNLVCKYFCYTTWFWNINLAWKFYC